MPYKVLTHDFRSPLQGGEPVWDGKALPFALPTVRLDTSKAGCAAGWNYVTNLAEGFRIAGLWPTGRPSTVFVVEPSADAITRGAKSRCSQITLLRFASEEEVANGVHVLSKPFGEHADLMASEQLAWRHALARPTTEQDDVIVAHLRNALFARGLDWKVKRFNDARDAWAAWDDRAACDSRDAQATRDGWAARAAWAARATWDARATRDGWAARAARAAWAAWASWDALDACDSRAAWAAWAALTHFFSAKMGWIEPDPNLLTVGLRDAYQSGAKIVLPTSHAELGWAK